MAAARGPGCCQCGRARRGQLAARRPERHAGERRPTDGARQGGQHPARAGPGREGPGEDPLELVGEPDGVRPGRGIVAQAGVDRAAQAGGRSGRARARGGTAPEAARRAVTAGEGAETGFEPVRPS